MATDPTTQRSNTDASLAIEDGRPLYQIHVEAEFWKSRAFDVYQKGVYTILLAYADRKDGTCYPSVSRLAAELQLSKPTVRKAIDELCAHGLLRKELRRTGDDRYFISNRYTILGYRPTPSQPDDVGNTIDYVTPLPTSSDLPPSQPDLPPSQPGCQWNPDPRNPDPRNESEGSGAAAPVVDATDEPALFVPATKTEKVRKPPAWAEQFSALIEGCAIPADRVAEYRGETNGAAKALGSKGYGAAVILAGAAEVLAKYGPDAMTPASLGKWVPRLLYPDGSPVLCESPPSKGHSPNGRSASQGAKENTYGTAQGLGCVAPKYAHLARRGPGSVAPSERPQSP